VIHMLQKSVPTRKMEAMSFESVLAKARAHVEAKISSACVAGSFFGSSTQHKLKGKEGCEESEEDYGPAIGAHRKLTFSLALRCRRGLRSCTKQKEGKEGLRATWEDADQKQGRL
jgi:hypothetical protein